MKAGDRVKVITLGGMAGVIHSLWDGKAGTWAWIILDGRDQPFTILKRDLKRERARA